MTEDKGKSLSTLSQDVAALTTEASLASGDHHSVMRGGQELYQHLLKLNHDVANLKKHGSPQLIDIQTFAERTWKVNLEYENYIAKLARERQALGNLVESIWHNFDNVILPLWRIDDDLIKIYEELASIRKQLESLQTLHDVNSNERSEFLVQLQSQLHQIENENVLDGKVVPPVLRNTVPVKVPSGQAIVMNLLQKCYRLIRVINETENVVTAPTLYPLESRLDAIIFDLESILVAYKNNEAVDPLELRMIQEHLLSIDRMQRDGKFLNHDGSIPEGQAVVREKLEKAYDLVHECLLNQPDSTPSNPDTILSSLSSTVSDTRDTLLSYASSISSAPLSTVQTLYNSLKSGTAYVRSGIPTLETPLKVADKARSQMVSALRAGLSASGKLFESLEGVDEKLHPVLKELVDVRSKLKKLKNERVAYRIRKMTDRDTDVVGKVVMESLGEEESNEKKKVEESPTAETKKFRRELEELQTELEAIEAKRVDGKFVDSEGNAVVKGQAYVQSVLDESFCLVFELLDFDDEAEW